MSLIQIKSMYVCKFSELLVLHRLLCEVWRVKSAGLRLTSDQSTVCMECFLIFRIIIELVQFWLKFDVILHTVHISAPK